MAIQWLQTQMVRLSTLRAGAKTESVSEYVLWYCCPHWDKWNSHRRGAKEDCSCIARGFARAFPDAYEDCDRTTQDCLVCLRNMMAHSAISHVLMISGTPSMVKSP